MTTVIAVMLAALAISMGVVALVAVPARRAGRDLLTPQGEQLVHRARERVIELRTGADDVPARTPDPVRD